MLHTAEKRYNFRSKLVDAKRIWGEMINGQWNGLIGLVSNQVRVTQRFFSLHSNSSFLQSVDFGICDASHTYHRSKVVDFTISTDVEEIVFISRGPIVKSQKWIIFEPFLFELWLALLVSTVVIWATLRWLSRDSNTFIVTKLYQILLCRGKLHCGIFSTQSAYDF